MLDIASRRIRPRIKDFLRESGLEEFDKYLPRNLMFVDQYTRFFIRLLDELTFENRKLVWIEKTPPHLHYVDYIE